MNGLNLIEEIWKMIKDILLERLQEKYKILRNKLNMNGTGLIFITLNLPFTLKLLWWALKYSSVLRQNKWEFLGVNPMCQHFLKLVSNSSEVLSSRVTAQYEENYKIVSKSVK